jgi:membrane-bound ClpP family serine protease
MPNRFRQKYRALEASEAELIDMIKQKAVELEELIEMAKDGRYKSLAMTSLEQAVMWAVKEITT